MTGLAQTGLAQATLDDGSGPMASLVDPLWLSLRVAAAATLLAALVGVPVAYALSRRRFAGRSVVEALLLLPLVLPPTVVGYALLMLLGARGVVGRHLRRWTGYSITFTFEGAVLAAAVVAFPLVYLPARGAFASVPREMEDVARINGANRWQLFWHVSIPLAARGLVSGLLLAFARALGEFGATLMVFGWQPGRQTLPVTVYAAYEQGRLADATGPVVLLTLVSLAVVFAYNRSSASRQG